MRFLRRGLRRIALGFAVLGLLTFAVIFLRKTEEIDKSLKIQIIERSIRSVINQGECRHPHLQLDNPEIMKFYKPVDKINCGDETDWVMCERSICFVKPEISSSHGEVICSYTDIIRKNDHRVRYGRTVKLKEPYVLQASDFVRVICNAESGHSWFGMAFGIRDTVEQSPISPNIAPNPILAVDIMTQQQQQEQLDIPLFFSVLMFGFDSLSRNAFIRKLPKTYAFLTKQLGAITLNGYNIVGDGTPQALVPLLTGYTELELPETRKRMPNSMSVDAYPMIWQDFAKLGYITSFNEDLPNVGTFTYRMNGFEAQPVDHYLRTYYLEANNILSDSKTNCIGHQPDHMVMLDYTKNFMLKHNEKPRFVFSFHGGLSHDSINLIGAADDDVHDWLIQLKDKGVFKNTILIFMADHGNRFAEVRATLQGKQEERLPFFSFAFPTSFKTRFPREYNNFVNNTERLTTPFDVHATLKHLISLQSTTLVDDTSTEETTYDDSSSTTNSRTQLPQISELASQRSISLFESIPKNRSCADAYIEPHWCACLNWEQLQLNDTKYIGTILKSVDSIIQTINAATNEYREFCAPIKLQRLNWALRLRPHKELLQFKTNKDRDGFLADMSDSMHINEEIYQMQIVTQPGEALFEASITFDLRNFSAKTKLSEISRVNKYGTQANCIYERNPEIRKYCYCRD